MSSTLSFARRILAAACVAAVGVSLLPETAQAQGTEDAAERRWSNATQLSWVMSTGNSSSGNFSVRNVYKYEWSTAQFYWESGILRATSVDDKYAIGAEGDYEVVTPASDLDHNRLFSKLRYYRSLSDRFFWFINNDSASDKPSNINSQFIGSAGIGNQWYERERLVFRTAYGFNYTFEDLDLEGQNSFGGYRLFYHLEAGVSDTTQIESELTFDGSFESADDVRIDSLNSLSVAITETLAFKGSLRLLFRNVPALDDIDLQDPESGAVIGTVVIPKEKLDTSVSMSLVINF